MMFVPPPPRPWRALSLLLLILTACNSGRAAPASGLPSPTISPLLQAPQPSASAAVAAPDAVTVVVDTTQNVHPISPLIYGVSGASRAVLSDLRPTANSWGGNPSTRYNWEHGTAWNAARDWHYTNVDYTNGEGGSASDRHIEDSLAYGAAVRMALPTLGWVARDATGACSFPNGDGTCGDGDMATCRDKGPVADPALTSVPSDVASVRRWIEHMVLTQGYDVRFFAMDNEPELWGETHYDVHPTCATYDEMLGKYLEYASMVREVAPDAELLGPVTCCWHYYWNSPSGDMDKLRHGNQEYIPWFLDEVRKHDEEHGVRILDVLDIHYYPDGVFGGGNDAATAAHRVRATRSLWDATYVDESWINEPIALVPRMKQVIAEHYPGLKLGITEWNFGGEDHISGALAVAETLGIFGREDLYLANYWTYPPIGSPAYLAFKLYTNYDGAGSRFGDSSVGATSSAEAVSAYAALVSARGELTLMLINKDPAQDLTATLDLRNVATNGAATLYRYSAAASGEIISQPFDLSAGNTITLPAASITLMVLEGP